MLRAYKVWQSRHIKPSYDQLRSITDWNVSGRPMSQAETELFASNVVQWATSVGELASIQLRKEDGVDWNIFRSIIQMVCRGPHNVTLLFKALKSLTDIVRNERSLSHYRHLNTGDYPGIVRPVYPCLRMRSSPEAFAVLHHYSVFMSKMGMTADGLEEQELEKYLENEARLGNLPPPARRASSAAIKDVITSWFKGWKKNPQITGHYTNGSTADAGRDLFNKLSGNGCITPSLALLLLKTPSLLSKGGPSTVRRGFTYFTSKWLLVPKNALALRGISEECAAANYWQSALDDDLRQYCRRTNFGEHCDFAKQSLSRDMVVAASRSGKYATTDLSSASDTLQLDQILYFFSEVPELLAWLLATRSRYTELPNGDVIELNKFAPMGSRLCFTIESIVFAACCKVACDHSGLPEHPDNYRVYGDDIIIRIEALRRLLAILADQGFIVNYDKSFWRGGFREACGVFAYRGVDVTYPLVGRKSCNTFKPEKNSDEVGALCLLANRFFVDGLYFTRYTIVACLLDDHLLPRFVDGYDQHLRDVLASKDVKYLDVDLSHYGLLSFNPTNYRIKSRERGVARRLYFNSGEHGFQVFESIPKWDKYEYKMLCTLREGQEAYTDDQRYEMWLYAASHTRRTEICWNITLPHEVPYYRLVIPKRPRLRWVQL